MTAPVRLPKNIRAPEIVTMPIAELRPAAYNPRTITAKRKDGLRASMRKFGNVQLVVWNKRTKTVVGGHQRLELLVEAGEKETQVIVVDLPQSQEKALNVALNNAQITGEFDQALLTPMLEQLEVDDADLFRDLNLDELLKRSEENLDTNSQLGDMKYRVIIECASEAEQVDLLDRFAAEGITAKGMIS